MVEAPGARAVVCRGISLAAAAVTASCDPVAQAPDPKPDAPPQSIRSGGYLWKRVWTPDVVAAARLAGEALDEVVVLAAEIDRWPSGGIPAEVVWPAVNPAALSGVQVGIAIRAPDFTGPFSGQTAEWRTLEATVHEAIASAHGWRRGALTEVQIDFDCPQRALAGYRTWLERLRPAVPDGTAFTITALPSWLGEDDWPSLAAATDGFVLQVHAVEAGSPDAPPKELCDPARAMRWATAADRTGKPFRVALPTYTSLAGFAPDGSLRGIISDGPDPAWPPDTRTITYRADPTAMSGLRHDLEAAGLAHFGGVIWFRLPAGHERHNWSWDTFAMVAAGPRTRSEPSPLLTGDQTVDVVLDYRGTLPGPLPETVRVSWSEDETHLVTADAVGTFQLVREHGAAVFFLPPSVLSSHAQGDGVVPVGWLRFHRANPEVDVELGE